MIEARELRIGNYVYDRGDKILRINGWENNTKIFQNNGTYMCEPFGEIPCHPLTEEVEFLKPIPLTEEILLKFGYIECGFRDNHFIIKGHTIWKCNDLFMCDKNGIVIKSTHQLQNLYHALTGQELTINKQ